MVKAYIESDLDDYIENENSSNFINQLNESLYQRLFIKLTKICFINKEVIANLYEYFSELYDKADEIKENDILLKKMFKVMNLFMTFYVK